jgi:DNA polymerase-3 subunit delta'
MPFSDVVGHDGPLGLLSRSIARGSLPPSLLFTGPEGVGKRLAAQAVAEALNCLSPVRGGVRPATGPEATAAGRPARRRVPARPVPAEHATLVLPLDACGECAACRRIAKGTHPDVLAIEPPDVGALKIEVVRPAIAATAYRPFEGRCRVVIVNEADRLTEDAQHALLKSLEEPAGGSVFVLVTSRSGVLLPTIRSRCSQVRFAPLRAGDVARLLTERHGFSVDDAFAAAAAADGSPGRAVASAARGFRQSRDSALATIQAVARGTSPRARVQAAMGLLAGKSSAAGERDELMTRIALMASLLRDLALVASGGRVEDLANGDLAAPLAELGGAFGRDRALRAYDAADQAIVALRRNASPKIVADWLAVHM